jgi:hypothetical protein
MKKTLQNTPSDFLIVFICDRRLIYRCVQWRRSGLKSWGTNPWRELEILKNDKNLGGQPVLASPTANSGGIRPPVIYAHGCVSTFCHGSHLTCEKQEQYSHSYGTVD